MCVTPLAGVWIEILVYGKSSDELASLPLRGCGLKSAHSQPDVAIYLVTPLAGVWIEMGTSRANMVMYSVTPLAGVWIEIIAF